MSSFLLKKQRIHFLKELKPYNIQHSEKLELYLQLESSLLIEYS